MAVKSVPTRIRELASRLLWRIRYFFYTQYYGMTIDPSSWISSSARLDKTNPKGVRIGRHSCITFGVAVLTHDMCSRKRLETRIGDNVFVGANSIIMPGIKIGNNVIIGAGSVVTKDVAGNSIVAGNPARVLKENVKNWYGIYGILDQ